jgi:hypothetical protein
MTVSSALPPGSYTLTFTLGGMQDVTRRAQVLLGQNGLWRSLGSTINETVHAVILAGTGTFTAQNHAAQPANGQPCGGSNHGRGCLILAGGVLVDTVGWEWCFFAGLPFAVLAFVCLFLTYNRPIDTLACGCGG